MDHGEYVCETRASHEDATWDLRLLDSVATLFDSLPVHFAASLLFMLSGTRSDLKLSSFVFTIPRYPVPIPPSTLCITPLPFSAISLRSEACLYNFHLSFWWVFFPFHFLSNFNLLFPTLLRPAIYDCQLLSV